MAKYFESAVTDAGRRLLEQSIDGEGIKISHAVCGDGYYPADELSEQMEILGQKQTANVVYTQDLAEGKIIRIRIDNENVSESYDMRQIGVYALDKNGDKVLFSISQSEIAEYIPGKDELPNFYTEVSLFYAVGCLERMSVSIKDQLNVTIGDLEDTENRIEAKITVIKDLIGKIPIDGGTFFEDYEFFGVDGGTF